MLTYGDGVADIDLSKLLEFHKSQGKLATITAVQPSGRFGALDIKDDGTISNFAEKPKGDGAFVNGGFMVFEYGVFDYIKNGDKEILERAPLENLAKDGQLSAYKHTGFWQPMDTMRDKEFLEKQLSQNTAEWVKW
jgi:glucose-1-phosphate cytidylyltransferase